MTSLGEARPATGGRRREVRWWLLLGLVALPLVALIARLAYAATLPPDIVITFEADPLTYDQIARNLLAGRGFSGASFYYPPGTDYPTAFWDALYPLFLAGVYSVFGHSIPAVRDVQAVLGAVAVGLTYLLGRRLGGPVTGIIAAGISAAYPFFIYYSAQLLTETLFMTLILGVFVVALEAARRPASRMRRAVWFAVLGVLTGLAALCRAEAFAFGIALVLWAAWRSADGWPACAWNAGIALALLLLVMLPWGVRNQLAHGQFILTTTKLGYNLYKYYHPQMTADQKVPTVPFPEFGDLTEPEREAVMRREGIRFMVEDPGRTVWFMLNKLALLFKLTPSNEVNQRYALVSLASYGALLPFMAAGAVLAARRGGLFWPVLAYVAFSVATKAMVFAGIRLRMQIEPFLIIFAALALSALLQRVAAGSAVGRLLGWPGLAATAPRRTA